MSNEEPVVHMGEEEAKHCPMKDYAHYLPKESRNSQPSVSMIWKKTNILSFIQGSGHGGSHPHLAHEFLMAVLEDRDPFPNVFKSANWTSVGILAHESAMQGGKLIQLPDYK